MSQQEYLATQIQKFKAKHFNFA